MRKTTGMFAKWAISQVDPNCSMQKNHSNVIQRWIYGAGESSCFSCLSFFQCKARLQFANLFDLSEEQVLYQLWLKDDEMDISAGVKAKLKRPSCQNFVDSALR